VEEEEGECARERGGRKKCRGEGRNAGEKEGRKRKGREEGTGKGGKREEDMVYVREAYEHGQRGAFRWPVIVL